MSVKAALARAKAVQAAAKEWDAKLGQAQQETAVVVKKLSKLKKLEAAIDVDDEAFLKAQG